ncbi:Protein FAM53A, partial [Dissostichus eleginoides]
PSEKQNLKPEEFCPRRREHFIRALIRPLGRFLPPQHHGQTSTPELAPAMAS